MNGSWIQTANDLASGFLPVLWRASWQGALFVAAAWLVCRAFPRIPAATRYWLWWFACLQFLARLVIAAPIQVPVLPAAPTNVVAIEAHQTMSLPGSGVQEIRAEPTVPVPNADPIPVFPNWELGLCSVWLLGLALTGGSAIRRLRRTRLLVAAAEDLRFHPVSPAVTELSQLVGTRAPAIRSSEDAPCAMLTGWLRPTIIVPRQGLRPGLESELRLGIVHELCHLKRRDLWFSIAGSLATAIFFFHPLAWVASREAASACEEACDAETLRLSGASPAAYARLLLDTARSRVSIAAMGAAFSYRTLQRRILMLDHTEPKHQSFTRRLVRLAIPLFALCAVPWTVTAQAPHKTKKTGHKATQKVSHKLARRTVSKHVAKVRLGRPINVPPAPVLPPGPAVANVPPRVARAFAPGAVAPSPASAEGVPVMPHLRSAPGAVPPAAISLPGPYSVSTAPAMPVAGLTVGGRGATVAAPPSMAPSLSPPGVAGRVGSTVAVGTIPASSVQAGAAPSTATVGLEYPIAPAAAGVPTRVDVGPRISRHHGDVTSVSQGVVTVSFLHTELSEAIDQMFTAAKVDYVMSADIKPDEITCSLHDAPIGDAVSAVLKGTHQKLTWRVENGVYYIVLRE